MLNRAIAVLAATIPATSCTSQSDSVVSASAPVILDGTYAATPASGGPVATFMFSNATRTFSLSRPGCAAETCSLHGTYVFTSNELSLTDPGTQETLTLAVEDLHTHPAATLQRAPTSSSLRPQDGYALIVPIGPSLIGSVQLTVGSDFALTLYRSAEFGWTTGRLHALAAEILTEQAGEGNFAIRILE
jgi:hypothetical protein